ncbi:hypothetical protein A2215_03490 [Candidatus Berkelbacteria bacterium RIFOXYA2_FULL_43_10]|uniref:Aminoglycoside phosphotransferase domain-containing protein n=1 Tax=Candidatus Berkelbacteria bacterium RIFOXYA2_FULL_43_10 TaxID=1797472 RepID=A0A1F5EAW8_9BACT|nr:MAG: hypothetical protein A2215_03490 [Candidatus Berkelbacteria bacterium RIFOXYA2_FULL_43_10]
MSNAEEYQKLIKDLEFTEIKPVIKDYSADRFIVRGTINRRDVLLKILPRSDKNRVKSYKKEFLVDKLMNEHNKDLKLPVIVKTKVLAQGQNDKYFWVIRKYYSGLSLSNYYPKKGMLRGYDIIRKTFLNARSSIIKGIVENLYSIQKIAINVRRFGVHKSQLQKRYEDSFDCDLILKCAKLLGQDLSHTISYTKSHRSEYFSEKYIVANVGDLVPPNIIVVEKNNIIFSDFEWFCFDNNTMDVAVLWIYFWRYKKWQDQLIKLTITNDELRANFRYSVIRVLLSKMLSIVSGRWGKIEMMDFYKQHKWAQYLKAAGESFEALMRVK